MTAQAVGRIIGLIFDVPEMKGVFKIGSGFKSEAVHQFLIRMTIVAKVDNLFIVPSRRGSGDKVL